MNSYNPTILVGPIIGKVTEDSARILIELDRNFPLTLNLYEFRDQNNHNSRNPSFVLTKNYNANMPKIFEFKNLRDYT